MRLRIYKWLLRKPLVKDCLPYWIANRWYDYIDKHTPRPTFRWLEQFFSWEEKHLAVYHKTRRDKK
jgi:hypothetical protein